MKPFKCRKWTFLLLLVTLSLLTACGTARQIKKLDSMKEAWAKQDYKALAAEPVSCQRSQEGCNQIRLIKGDACFRLAKQQIESRRHYECAAEQLEEGIGQTTDWNLGTPNLNRAQTYENLLESLRQWQDLEKGTEAEALTQRLLKTAETFLREEPGNLAAVYFQASAQLTMKRAALLKPERSPGLCQEINAILRPLEEADGRAKNTPYEVNYHRLGSDLRLAKQVVPECR